ncbi:MAG: hypothetical protein IJP31_06630 [Lachnospiraceae bacterium]|nr:hypothetical protein [Lachnospiraceae bacterium]
MKKYFLAVTLMVTLGLAAGCGAAGVSGDVTMTTVEQESTLLTEEDMELQETGEVMTLEVTEEATDAAAMGEESAETDAAAMDAESTETDAATSEAVDDPQAPAETEAGTLSVEEAE